MRCKKLLSMSIALMAISGSAQALDILPTLTPVVPYSAPIGDWNYWINNQSVSLTYSAVTGDYTLNATSTGTFSVFNQLFAQSYIGNANEYSLSATFDKSGNFIANAAGSDYLKITGYFNDTTAAQITADTGAIAPTSTSGTNLLQANLTGFGYNTAQDTLGFSTLFTGGWTTQQPNIIGSSKGQAVYLYDPLGLNSDGTANSSNELASIISAFDAKNLGFAPTTTINNINTIASLPVPFSGVLFGTGLTALLGLSRRSNRKA
ncbi:hypothetical protein [Methylomonas sp. AM2-LC]|uniref:hypothetical protein n=1 Tax=Methylomonas sp. AM2-LC TaxID=3153301 RepID=UPI0032679B4B